MEEEGLWDSLPPEEHQAVWTETEQKFWSQFWQDQRSWRATHETRFRATSTDLRVDLSNLTGQRNALSDTQARLARELAKVEEELRLLSARYDARSTELTTLDEEYRAQLGEQTDKWQHQSNVMTNFFRKKRGERPLSDSELAMNGHGPLRLPTASVSPANRSPLSTQAPVQHQPRGTDKLVDVVDADDNVIGPLQRIEPWNQWVEAILKLPIQRPVKIRRGRRFNEEHLNSVYERSEAKGVKWLSCMIQAIGEVQSKRCHSCDKNQGAFEKCIIVGGDLLQKCGNCEWNRQGCHGASGETISIEAAERYARQQSENGRLAISREENGHREAERYDRERWARDEANRQLAHHEYQRQEERRERELRERCVSARNAVAADQAEQAAQAARAAQTAHVSHYPQPAPPALYRPAYPDPIRSHEPIADHMRRHPLPSVDRSILNNSGSPSNTPLFAARGRDHPGPVLPPPVGMLREQSRDYPPAPGNFTAANHRGFPPSNQRTTPPMREIHTPPIRSVEHSPQPMELKSDTPLTEINRDNLILRHDGNTYTYPQCMVGVPVGKIHPGHPYWEPDWKDVRAEIMDAREKWQQKHQAAIDAEARNEKTGSSKYQIGRQVNRGTKIIEFLDDEKQISPYQLLGKRFMHSSKGGITSYDTLFRLCETLSELSKFHLDVTPVDWLRQRLHELMVEKDSGGERNFNLPKTVHDFYHDPKLSALRHKHGYKNIGRPSGQTKGPGGRQSMGSTNGGSPMASKKRKSEASYMSSSRENSYFDSPLGNQMIIHDEGPFLAARSQLAKRPKNTPSPPSNSVADEGFSDKDSVMEEPLTREDFRLLQVQSRLHASSTKDMQLWSWDPEARKLEHRVLKHTKPLEWGTLKESPDFSISLNKVAEIQYDAYTKRAYVNLPAEKDTSASVGVQRSQGDLMVEFKRARTLRRFVAFCESMKVPLVELSAGSLDQWEDFQTVKPQWSEHTIQDRPISVQPAVVKT